MTVFELRGAEASDWKPYLHIKYKLISFGHLAEKVEALFLDPLLVVDPNYLFFNIQIFMASSVLLTNQQTQSKSAFKSASAGSVTRFGELAATSNVTLSASRTPDRAPASAFNGGVSPRDREAALEMAAAAAGGSPSHAPHSPVHWDSDSELSQSISMVPSPRVAFDAHGNPVPIAAELAPDIDRAISSSVNSFLFGMRDGDADPCRHS